LYLCKKIGDSWGKPINLGAKINTDKNEAFPFIHDDGKLYFSSDNTEGMGGMDIYYTSVDAKEGFKTPEPLNPPFNSEKDDFGFIINPENKEGYFSSDRDGGVGEDDIYGFYLPGDVIPFSEVKQLSDNYKDTKNDKNARIVTVYTIDRKTSTPLSNVFLCKASTGNQLPTAQTAGDICETTITDTTGKAVVHMVLQDNYFIRIIKPEYKPVQLSIMKDDNRDNFIILMDKIQDITEEKTDKKIEPKPAEKENIVRSDDRIFYLRNIYYDYNDYTIRWDARETLDSLVKILKNFPDMEVEVAAHTDSRGNIPYNLKLSKQRANSVIDYLTDRGITRNRLQPVGYGELQPVNGCGDGVPCPPEQHELNRRTEIRILRSGSALGKVFPQGNNKN
jgi:outer membrane protein OmpA-like peptidoglycan-associated protein